MHSASCLISEGLRIHLVRCQVKSKDTLTIATQTMTEDSDIDVRI